MAYVKITGELIDRILTRVDRMKGDALKHLQVGELVEGSLDHAAVADLAIRQVWGEHYPLKAKMPKDWCVELARIEVAFNDINGTQRHSTHMDMDDKNNLFPPGTTPWGMGRVPIEHEVTPASVLTWLDGIVAAEAKANECREKFKTIKTQIKNFLCTHTSLNTAVKELPELTMYVTEGDMERLHRKATRAKRAPRVPGETEPFDIDADLLASTAVANRLQNSR